jgi:hypothetical protein
MNGATTIKTAAELGRGRRLRRRHLWLIPGIAIAILANMLGEANGVGIVALVAFGIAPDLPRLLGARGRPIHNVLHHPLLAGAAAVTAIALTPTGMLPIFWLVGALVWVGHIVAGWGVGDIPHGGGEPPHA